MLQDKKLADTFVLRVPEAEGTVALELCCFYGADKSKNGSSCQQIWPGYVQGSSFLDWCKLQIKSAGGKGVVEATVPSIGSQSAG